MRIVNDNGCSWINDLNPRSNIKILKKNESCDWLIVGAGYTGLSAARKMAQLNPNHKIIIMPRKSSIGSKFFGMSYFR